MAAVQPKTSRRTAAEPSPRGPSRVPLEPLGVLALIVGCIAAYVAWPILPTYDLAHQLLWGHDLWHGMRPEFSSFRAPTEHPLALLLGLVLGPLGRFGEHAAVIVVLATFPLLVAGTFTLARELFGRWVAWATALLVVSRLDYAALAIRSYLDVPYLALMMWAAALEVREPRRGGPVWLLLFSAGLLRPESWLITGLYALWVVSGVPWWWRPQRAWIRPAMLAAAAPLVWFAVDWAVAGDPLFSLTYTAHSANELMHRVSAAQAPATAIDFLTALLKWPILVACLIGFALAAWRERSRIWVPVVLIASGIGSFLLLVALGFAAVDRYVAISALGLQVFGGYTLAGWTRLEPGRLRTAWVALAGVCLVAGTGFALTHTRVGYITKDLDIRVGVPQHLNAVLRDPRVVAARRCGPVTLPNQKLIADVRMALGDVRADQVLARADPRAARATGGVALVVTSHRLTWHPAYTTALQGHDAPSTVGPPPGYVLAIDDHWFAAYVRC